MCRLFLVGSDLFAVITKGLEEYKLHFPNSLDIAHGKWRQETALYEVRKMSFFISYIWSYLQNQPQSQAPAASVVVPKQQNQCIPSANL